MARSLYFQTCFLLVVLAVFCSAQEIVPLSFEAEAPSVIQVVDPQQPAIASDPSTAEGEGRPKRQFLAGLLVGSLLGGGHHHHHGYGYGRPHYGGYGYRRPQYHHHHGYYGYGK